MRVIVAGRHAGMRAALRLLVTRNLGMNVVGEAAHGDDLWVRLGEIGADLLLLEWGLLGAEVAAAMARLRTEFPGLRIMVLSGRPEARREALAAGADAFLSTGDSPERIVMALRASGCASCEDETEAGDG
jgi:DNA-binding NarL/FixJ family response regulator